MACRPSASSCSPTASTSACTALPRQQDRARLRERLGLAPDRFVGVFVGRLHPVKDVDTLLAAAAMVPELELVIVGDGPERPRLEARARRLGVERRVSFRGFSPRVVDVLRASDAFLLSSHGEGMSNALLEAMACGLPCLVSRSVGGARGAAGRGTRPTAGRRRRRQPGQRESSASWTSPRCRPRSDARPPSSSPRGCRSRREPTGSCGPTRPSRALPRARWEHDRRGRSSRRPLRRLALPQADRDLRRQRMAGALGALPDGTRCPAQDPGGARASSDPARNDARALPRHAPCADPRRARLLDRAPAPRIPLCPGRRSCWDR